MHILGISGSLRKNSLNTAALRACQALLPPGVSMEITDLIDVPIYNDDVREHGLPVSVKLLREKIAAADALVIASPEYNYSMSGVLKNAIDWVSRPPGQPLRCSARHLVAWAPRAPNIICVRFLCISTGS